MARKANRGRDWLMRTGYQLPTEDGDGDEVEDIAAQDKGEIKDDQVDQVAVIQRDLSMKDEEPGEIPMEMEHVVGASDGHQIALVRSPSLESNTQEMVRLIEQMDAMRITADRSTEEITQTMGALIKATNGLITEIKDLKYRISELENKEKEHHKTVSASIKTFDQFQVLPKLNNLLVAQECKMFEGEPSAKRRHMENQPRSKFCYICRGNAHQAEDCNVYPDGPSRAEAMQRYGRCKCCTKLLTTHDGQCPRAERECVHCKERHLNALCPTRYPRVLQVTCVNFPIKAIDQISTLSISLHLSITKTSISQTILPNNITSISETIDLAENPVYRLVQVPPRLQHVQQDEPRLSFPNHSFVIVL